LLPRTSTEDFLAVNNLISALHTIGWQTTNDQFQVRDTSRLDEEDKKKNLIVFCSAKSNELAREIQETLIKQNIEHYCFVHIAIEESGKQWAITSRGGYFPSPTSKRLEEYQKGQELASFEASKSQSLLYQEGLEDFAAITKITNPWNPNRTIIMVAGIRGIGTWGAAEAIKKWYGKIWREKKGPFKGSQKNGDFSALLRVRYRNSDIQDVEVVGIVDIQQRIVTTNA
jgi:hypothetical protein